MREFLSSVRTVAAQQILHTKNLEIHIGETVVVGRIDRIDSRPDGTVAIVDYKTGKARDQEDADESLQLSLYAIAAQEKWGYKVGALIFHNLAENVPVITIAARFGIDRGPPACSGAAQRIAEGIFDAKTRYPLQFLRVSKPLPREGKAHPTRADSLRLARTEFDLFGRQCQ